MEYALKNMLAEKVIEMLTQRLITDVSDGTKASTVREGKFQDDPTRSTGVTVLLWSSDDDDPDELNAKRTELRKMIAPTYEVGGGRFYLRKFKVFVLMHFKGARGDEGRLDSKQKAEVVMARVRHTLIRLMNNFPINPNTDSISDDFGEVPTLSQVEGWFLKESGGSGQFIWNGELKFSVLTEQLIDEEL